MTWLIAQMYLITIAKIIESESDSDEDLDNHFYNVEDILKTRVFDTPNQDIYTSENFIIKVKIEMILPFGKLTSFDHKVHEKRKNIYINNTSTRC